MMFGFSLSNSINNSNLRLSQKMRLWIINIYIIISVTIFCPKVQGTIDVNLSELEYLAARLDPYECRRLIAALHYTTYDLPKDLAAAVRTIDEEIPCLPHLLHWNNYPKEGRGKTHAVIVHRLRQLHRNDLADWLGKTAFKQLGKDLDDAISSSFEDLGKEETTTVPAIAATERIQEEDLWLPIDTFLIASVLGLLGILFVLIAAIITHTIKLNRH